MKLWNRPAVSFEQLREVFSSRLARLLLKFNSRVEARPSSVWLVGGPRNTRVLLLMPEAIASDTLVYSLPELLLPGEYRAEWKVLSVDGHVTEGVLRFTMIENAR